MATGTRRKHARIVAASVAEIPGKQLACRVHHPWPSERLIDSQAVPRGFVALSTAELRVAGYRVPDGMWWVLDECPRCGKNRYKRYPGRVYDGSGWHYIEPRDWVRFEEKFSSADAFEANIQRNFRKLFRDAEGA